MTGLLSKSPPPAGFLLLFFLLLFINQILATDPQMLKLFVDQLNLGVIQSVLGRGHPRFPVSSHELTNLVVLGISEALQCNDREWQLNEVLPFLLLRGLHATASSAFSSWRRLVAWPRFAPAAFPDRTKLSWPAQTSFSVHRAGLGLFLMASPLFMAFREQSRNQNLIFGGMRKSVFLACSRRHDLDAMLKPKQQRDRNMLR